MQILLIRALAILIGCALVSTKFLYEDEEKRLQSSLEDWWVRLSYRSDQAYSQEALFLRGVSSSTSRFLAKIFGDATISLRSISVSISCSTIPILLIAAACNIFLPRIPLIDEALSDNPPLQQVLSVLRSTPLYIRVVPALIAFGLIIALIIPSLYPRARWLYVASAIACLAPIAYVLTFLRDPQNPDYAFAVSIPITALCQLYAIAVTRRVMRKSASATSAGFICALLVLNLMTFALIIFAPFALKFLTGISIFTCVGFENIVGCFILLLFALLAVTMLLHRCLWPTVLRPLYFLQRHRVFEHRLLLVGAGLSLVTGTLWSWGDLWKHLGTFLVRALTQ